jgi:hypothetical protein
MPTQDNTESELEKKLRERFEQLPAPVQRAITSSEIQKHLRELANVHKLHIDQWELLENEVRLTLYGFQSTDSLAKNIEHEVGTTPEEAAALSADISKIVFEPVRQELERQLDHPAAVAAVTTGVEDVRNSILESKTAATVPAAENVTPSTANTQTPGATTEVPGPAQKTVAPATPPASSPIGQVERAPAPSTYAPATPSHERKSVEGDPYREQLT